MGASFSLAELSDRSHRGPYSSVLDTDAMRVRTRDFSVSHQVPAVSGSACSLKRKV